MVKVIKPNTKAEHEWPRKTTKSVECRKRDVVVRVTDWWDDEDEPAYDVEVYIGGVYDWNESESFTRHSGHTKATAKQSAASFAGIQIAKFL